MGKTLIIDAVNGINITNICLCSMYLNGHNTSTNLGPLD